MGKMKDIAMEIEDTGVKSGVVEVTSRGKVVVVDLDAQEIVDVREK